MKKSFSGSPHIVSGLCESLKTASMYKKWILEKIKAQLANNPFLHKRGESVNRSDAASVPEDDRDTL